MGEAQGTGARRLTAAHHPVVTIMVTATLAPAQAGALFCPLFPETRVIYQGVGSYCAGSTFPRLGWRGDFPRKMSWPRSGGALFVRPPLSSEDSRDKSQVLPLLRLPLSPASVRGFFQT